MSSCTVQLILHSPRSFIKPTNRIHWGDKHHRGWQNPLDWHGLGINTKRQCILNFFQLVSNLRTQQYCYSDNCLINLNINFNIQFRPVWYYVNLCYAVLFSWIIYNCFHVLGIFVYFRVHIDGLVQNCSNPSALAMKLLQTWLSHRYVGIQYIPRNMHTVFALLCFVVVIHWLIFPYPSGLLHWHCGNLTIAPVPAKQPRWIWMNTSCEFIMNDCITTTKQSTTKPCAYLLGYTVPNDPSVLRSFNVDFCC